MGAGLFKGGFDRPALDEKGQHLLGCNSLVGAKQGLGWELSVGLFDQQPADGHRGQSGVIPYGRVRNDNRRDDSTPSILGVARTAVISFG